MDYPKDVYATAACLGQDYMANLEAYERANNHGRPQEARRRQKVADEREKIMAKYINPSEIIRLINNKVGIADGDDFPLGIAFWCADAKAKRK